MSTILTQGSSFLATLGLEAESLWDSAKTFSRNLWVIISSGNGHNVTACVRH